MAKEKDPNPPVEKMLSLSGIQTMKKADIIKEFKALKSFWATKATAVIVFLAFNKNADKKKVTIALPYKKDTDMRQQFKEIKAKKIHPMQRIAAGLFSVDKEKKEVTITLTNGGAKEEALLKMGGKLFDLLKWTLKIKLAADFEGEQPDPVDTDDDEEEEAFSEEESAQVDDAAEEAQTKTDVDLIDKLKTGLVDVAGKMKNQVQAVIMGKIRSKQAEQDDLDAVEGLQKGIAELKKMYESAADTVKNAFAKNVEGILSYLPGLDKIKTAIQDLLVNGVSSSGYESADPEANKQQEELQKQWEAIQKEMDTMANSISKTVDDLKKAAGEVLEGGKELLKKLQ